MVLVPVARAVPADRVDHREAAVLMRAGLVGRADLVGPADRDGWADLAGRAAGCAWAAWTLPTLRSFRI